MTKWNFIKIVVILSLVLSMVGIVITVSGIYIDQQRNQKIIFNKQIGNK